MWDLWFSFDEHQQLSNLVTKSRNSIMFVEAANILVDKTRLQSNLQTRLGLLAHFKSSGPTKLFVCIHYSGNLVFYK